MVIVVENMNKPILASLEHLLEGFATIIASGAFGMYEGRISLSSWQNQLDRLQDWPPRAQYSGKDAFSLDYLLRDSHHIQSHLLWLISGLERLINRSLRLSNNHSLTEKTECDSNNQNMRRQFMSEEELSRILDSISRTTDCLYQMQLAIQRPAQESLLSRISRAKIKSYEDFDKENIRDKYPQADQILVDRLGLATSKRRAILKFRAEERSNQGKDSFGNIKGKILKEPSQSNVAHHQTVQTSTACPLCHFTITPHQTWAQHVFQDILPYMCLAKHCETPTKLYENCSVWYSHMTVQHRVEFACNTAYKCPLCGADLQRSELKRHLAGHLEAIAVFALPDLTLHETSKLLDVAGKERLILKLNTLLDELVERRKGEGKNEIAGSSHRSEVSEAEWSEKCNKNGDQGYNDEDNLQRGNPENEIDKKEKILNEYSPFVKAENSPKKESDNEACLDHILHQSPIRSDNQTKRLGPQPTKDHSEENENEYQEEKTRLPQTFRSTSTRKAGSIGRSISVPNLKPTFEVLQCDICYSIFDRLSAAESHGIEEGHPYFVDITEETMRQCEKDSGMEQLPDQKDAKTSAEKRAFRRALWNEYPDALSRIMSPEEILKTQATRDVMEAQMRHAVQRLERDFGPNDEMVLSMVGTLAHTLKEQGKLDEAEKLYRRAFNGNKAASGISSPATLRSLRSLAVLLYERRDYKQAETKLRQTVAGLERIKDMESRDIIDTVHNLGQALQSQSNFEDAEILFRRAWNWRKENLGASNSDTLSSLQGLAICLQRRDDYSSAEMMLRDALQVCESAFGKDSFETLRCMFNLSRVIHQQERYREAKELYQRVFTARKKFLKGDTESALGEIYDKSIQLRHQGKLRAAENMAQRAIDGFERIKGRKSERTLFSLNSLGIVLRQQGRLQEAAELISEVAEGLEKLHGRHHFESQKSFLNLSNIWTSMGRYQSSEKILRRELEPARQSQGRDDPMVVAIVINLATSIRAQGRVQPAIHLLEEEIEWFQQLLTKNSDHSMAKRVGISKIITQLKDHIEHLSP